MLTRMYNYWNTEEYELAVEGQEFLETKLAKLKENLDGNNLVLKKTIKRIELQLYALKYTYNL